jgi:hypothetical protein
MGEEMNQLTTIAALPGSGAGCASVLKREVSEQRLKYATGGLVSARAEDDNYSGAGVVTNVTIGLASADAKALIAKQIAESTRRTLLRIAGATA